MELELWRAYQNKETNLVPQILERMTEEDALNEASSGRWLAAVLMVMDLVQMDSFDACERLIGAIPSAAVKHEFVDLKADRTLRARTRFLWIAEEAAARAAADAARAAADAARAAADAARAAADAARAAAEARADQATSALEHITSLQISLNGLPDVDLVGSPSSSHSAHSAVEFNEADFGLFELRWHSRTPSDVYSLVRGNRYINLPYVSENDIAGYSQRCLLDLLEHLEDGDGNPYEMLSGIRVISEFSVASVRPDIVALKNRVGPIGFCEVKRPSPTSDASPLDNRSILGQAFDYAVELRNSYGIRWPFVLLTTFTEWRVVWLNDPACIYAASATSLDALLDGPGPAALTEERFLFCSRIVNGVGNAEIARFLSTVLLKMAHSPIEDLGANKLWPLFKLSGIKWVTLSTGQEWTYELPVDAQPPFVGLQTLGSGRDGRCWLVLKENKRFVLKILKPFVVEDVGGRHAAAEKAAQEEAGRWSVWNVQAKYLTVLDHAAIVMPFVETFKSLDEARSRRSDIQAALEKLARAGYAHMDLRNNDNSFKYAHFGELSGHIVAIDLSEVKTGLTYEDALSQMDVDGLLRLLE